MCTHKLNNLPVFIAFSINCFCLLANSAISFCCLSFALFRRSSRSRFSFSRCSSSSHSCIRGHNLFLVSMIICLHMGSKSAIFLRSCDIKNGPSPIRDSLGNNNVKELQLLLLLLLLLLKLLLASLSDIAL